MSKTDFYFIETEKNELHDLICHIVEYFYREGIKVQIVASSHEIATQLDKKLWSFSQKSFVPHKLVEPDGVEDILEQVVITVDEYKLDDYRVLIYDGMVNLEFIKNYLCVIHFVVMDDMDRRSESRSLMRNVKKNVEQIEHIQHIPYIPVPNIKAFLNLLYRIKQYSAPQNMQ